MLRYADRGMTGRYTRSTREVLDRIVFQSGSGFKGKSVDVARYIRTYRFMPFKQLSVALAASDDGKACLVLRETLDALQAADLEFASSKMSEQSGLREKLDACLRRPDIRFEGGKLNTT